MPGPMFDWVRGGGGSPQLGSRSSMRVLKIESRAAEVMGRRWSKGEFGQAYVGMTAHLTPFCHESTGFIMYFARFQAIRPMASGGDGSPPAGNGCAAAPWVSREINRTRRYIILKINEFYIALGIRANIFQPVPNANCYGFARSVTGRQLIASSP